MGSKGEVEGLAVCCRFVGYSRGIAFWVSLFADSPTVLQAEPDWPSPHPLDRLAGQKHAKHNGAFYVGLKITPLHCDNASSIIAAMHCTKVRVGR